MDSGGIDSSLHGECVLACGAGIFRQRKNGQANKDRVRLHGYGSVAEHGIFDWGCNLMVKMFGKKEKREAFANGRIVVTDFKKLNADDFPNYKNGDMFFMDFDGRIYIDSREEANEPIVSVLKVLVQYPKVELQKWERERKRLYPGIREVTDLEKLKGNNEDFMKALSMFLVPMELKSREAEKAYYG